MCDSSGSLAIGGEPLVVCWWAGTPERARPLRHPSVARDGWLSSRLATGGSASHARSAAPTHTVQEVYNEPLYLRGPDRAMETGGIVGGADDRPIRAGARGTGAAPARSGTARAGGAAAGTRDQESGVRGTRTKN